MANGRFVFRGQFSWGNSQSLKTAVTAMIRILSQIDIFFITKMLVSSEPVSQDFFTVLTQRHLSTKTCHSFKDFTSPLIVARTTHFHFFITFFVTTSTKFQKEKKSQVGILLWAISHSAMCIFNLYMLDSHNLMPIQHSEKL